jgi:hypothetical protein
MPPRLLSFEMPVIVGHLRNEHRDVNMAGDFRRHIVVCIILIALTCLSPSANLNASELPTTEDKVAEHEFAIAKPELDRMNHVLDVEMKRLTLEAGGSPSHEAAKYLNVSPTKHVDLGDVQIPLHARFIERRRRSWVTGISFANASMSEHCDSPDLRPDQLLDATLRAKVLAALRCHQRKLDRYQTGAREANQQYTAMLVELKLPPLTQQKMLAEAVQSETSGNVELSHKLAGQRRSLQANLDFFSYVDAHAAHARYVNNELVFDDPAESKEFHELAVGARIESMSLRR